MLDPISLPLPNAIDRSYRIFFQSMTDLPLLLKEHHLVGPKVGIVTDANVEKLYRQSLEATLQFHGFVPHWLTLPAGETTKSLQHLSTIFDHFLGYLDRQTPLIALGGGVIGDLTGFAAASILRGVPFVQVPTTLMAQVDSSVGGKTGINHSVGKNLIGAFHQPTFVLCDSVTVQSLPIREWHAGLAEVVKHALITDHALFNDLVSNWSVVLDRVPETIAPIIRRSVAIKAAVVAQDETEQGIRAHLNFGHTFAHAIEQVTGYNVFLHGEAVTIGMVAALHVSKYKTSDFPFEKALGLVKQLPVPVSAKGIDVLRLTEAMKADKKAQSGQIRLVLLSKIGEAYVTDQVPPEAVQEAWRFALSMF
ncbi:MAG: 3-dehydroquinate synthase [Rhodothermia bacterium]|nr:3-dehydroquinate synthase [Rhodothermia bacterium]